MSRIGEVDCCQHKKFGMERMKIIVEQDVNAQSVSAYHKLHRRLFDPVLTNEIMTCEILLNEAALSMPMVIVSDISITRSACADRPRANTPGICFISFISAAF
jgi:hypothetical protein